MDNIKEEYQKNYVNVLAKLGEVELIINLHTSMKKELLVQLDLVIRRELLKEERCQEEWEAIEFQLKD